jgi:Cd2+/Zn2+-exporting ATPase
MGAISANGAAPVFTPLVASGPSTLSPMQPHAHGIACACGHDHGEGGHSHAGVRLSLQLAIVLPISVALLVLAYGRAMIEGRDDAVAGALGLVAAAISGGPILWQAIKGLSRGKTNVNELVSLSIVGAVVLGMPLEAGLVALILQIGALIESVATESASKAVLALQKLAPKHARIRRNNMDEVIETANIRAGDILVVQPGERIAADGKLVSGSTSVDESSVTGESVPVDKADGSEMLAGTINLTGSAEVLVERVGEHSALGQTIALVARAQQFQPEIIRAADKFFALYTPIVLFISLIVLWVTGEPIRMVTMWVVGCPCAMLLASPLAIVVSLARASRSGIQVKAGPFVEASAGLKTVVFDKTGTLTTGKFIVSAIRPAAGVSAAELLQTAATIESRSSHPLARAIVDHAAEQSLHPTAAADVHVLEGLGVEARINGTLTRAGSLKLLTEQARAAAAALAPEDSGLPVVPVYVVAGDRLLGAVFLTDAIREEAATTIRLLRTLGIDKVVMLTGDRKQAAERVARVVGCDEVFAELLPGQKVDVVRALQRGGRGVAMVGDGINDAPSLTVATVGIAMGVRGTDVAIKAADAVLLKDDLTRVPLLIYLAQQTRWAIYQNLIFSMVFAVAAEAAAAWGWLNPVAAALVHVAGVIVIAINSVRLAGAGGRTRAQTLPVREAAPAAQDFPSPPPDSDGLLLGFGAGGLSTAS